MLILTCSGLRPSTPATFIWSTVWNCSPFHTSHAPSLICTTQFIGSIVACARYGNSYDASTVLAAPASAFSASPVLAAERPGFAASALYCAMSSAEPSLPAPDSSHCTLSASRPRLADQKSVASTATPVGICTTFTTPRIDFALAASNDWTFAPKIGGGAQPAGDMPRSFTLMV